MPVTHRFVSLAAVAVIIATAHCAVAAEPPEGVKNFFSLHNLYLNWTDALFGSRHFNEQKLTSYLVSLLGKEITTDHDFMLSSPEGVIDKTMVCIFRNGRWLYVHGELDEASLKLLSGSGFEALKAWWRSGVLVALSGKVKFFKLDRDAHGGDIVHLYLEKISVLK
jgi:hypothetical protein